MNKTDLKALNQELKKQDKYLFAKKEQGAVIIYYEMSTNEIMRISDHMDENPFSFNGFNYYNADSLEIIRRIINAIQEWDLDLDV